MPFGSFERIPINQPSPERKPFPQEKERKDFKKLETYLKETAEKLRKEGVPVDDNLRINPEAFKEIYSPQEVESDVKNAREKMNEFEINRPKGGKEWANRFEEYVTAILNKHMGEEFIVVRTAEYDDLYGHADNLLVDKKTGIPICAFDEVNVMEGPTYEEKREKVLSRNLPREGVKGGVTIKYGFTITPEGEIKLKRLRNVPIFYLALSREALKRGLEEFTLSKEETSEYEKNMVNYFLTSLQSQAARLKLEERLSPEVREKIEFFEGRLRELSKEGRDKQESIKL